jgi:SAM-dependent methyltransferase
VYEATVRQYVHPECRILDLGCGRGGLVELLQDQVALVAGVDPDRLSLLEHRAPGMGRIAGLAERLPFTDESFDLVICSWVLEHLDRPRRALSEVARVLQGPDPDEGRLGGHFVFLTPNALHPLCWANRLVGRFGGSRAWLVRRLYGRDETDAFSVVYRVNTRRHLEQVADAVGLCLVTFRCIGDPSYLAFSDPLYRLATLAERLTPRRMKVHLVGDFVKGTTHDPSR